EFDLLVMYPDVKIARHAVEQGLSSANADIRASAERAMHPSAWSVDTILRNEPSTQAASLSMQDAMAMLLAAKEFVVIDEATAADAAGEVLALRRINAAGYGEYAAAYHLLRSGTAAGKLYGFSILYFKSRPDFPSLVESVRTAGGTIELVDAGTRSTRPI